MLQVNDDEKIIATFRKHWFIPLLQTIVVSFLFVVPIGLVMFAANKTFSTDFATITFTLKNPAVAVFVLAFWGLFLWLRFFTFWSDHHLDGWVLTDKRVINIEQRGFFRRDIASFRLERLQDVTTEVRGFIATLFRLEKFEHKQQGQKRSLFSVMPKTLRRLRKLFYENMTELFRSMTIATQSQALTKA